MDDTLRRKLAEDIKKRLGHAIHMELSSGLTPKKAIPSAIAKLGLNINPQAVKVLIEIHEREIERLNALRKETYIIPDQEYEDLKAKS